MHHAFISYARADLDPVLALAVELQAGGVAIWIDQRDIPVSVPWFDEVTAAIQDADIVVVCESLRWYQSRSCLLELHAARAAGKKIVHLELPGDFPEGPASWIAAELNSCSATLRTHTDVLALARAWDQSSRPKSGLATGALLRSAQAVGERLREETGADVIWPDTARAFLAASGRTERIRNLVGTYATLAIVLAVLVGVVAGIRHENGRASYEKETQNYTAFANTYQSPYQDIYDELRSSSQYILAGNPNFMARTRLVNALGVKVPTWSGTLQNSELVGFAGTELVGEPRTVDSRGRIHFGVADVAEPSGGPDLAASTVASSADGSTILITGSGPTYLSSRDGRREMPHADIGAIAADGALAATAAEDRLTLATQSGETTFTVTMPRRVTAIAVLPSIIVAGTEDGALFAVDRKSHAYRVMWRADSRRAVTHLAGGPNGRVVAVAWAGDARIRLLAPEDSDYVRVLPADGVVTALAFSPDTRLLAASVGADVSVFSVRDGFRTENLRGSIGEVRVLAWSADGSNVWALTRQGRVTTWKWRTATVLVNDRDVRFVNVLGPRANGNVLAVTSSGVVHEVNSAGGVGSVISTGLSGVTAAAASRDGRFLSFIADNSVVVRNVSNGAQHVVPLSGCPRPQSTALGPTGALYVICGTEDLAELFLYLIEPETGVRLGSADLAPYDWPLSAAVDAAGELFVGGALGGAFLVSPNLTDVRRIRSSFCGQEVRAATWTSDGKTAISTGNGVVVCSYVGHRDGENWTWNALVVNARNGEQSRAAALSSDGSLTAVGFADGTVAYSDNVTAGVVGSYTDQVGGIVGLAFLPDTAILVVATRSGMLLIQHGCPLCGSATHLARLAATRIEDARQFGLTR